MSSEYDITFFQLELTWSSIPNAPAVSESTITRLSRVERYSLKKGFHLLRKQIVAKKELEFPNIQGSLIMLYYTFLTHRILPSAFHNLQCLQKVICIQEV